MRSINGIIYLTSNGLSSQRLQDHFIKHSQEMKEVVLITTASSYKSEDYHIPEIRTFFQTLEMNVSCLDIEVDDLGPLKHADVIYFIGGNPFYLINCMQRTEIKSVLKTHLDQSKIIIGASAGSIALTKSSEIVYEFDPQMNDDVKLETFEGLGLIDIEMCPHFERFKERYENFTQRLETYEVKLGVQLIRINDGEAMIQVNNKLMKFV